MDTGRLSQGQMIAAISGLVLFISLFLKWTGVETPDLPEGAEGVPGLSEAVAAQDQTGWESQSSLDIYMLIVALLAVVPAGLALTGSRGELPFAGAGTTLLLGVIAVILMFFTMFVGFPEGAERKFGMWLALIASIGVAVGGYLAAQEEGVPGAPAGGNRY